MAGEVESRDPVVAEREEVHVGLRAHEHGHDGAHVAHVAPGWRGALREFVVIVAGVLAALGAQALWQDYQDRARERDYLRRMLADTRENEIRLEHAMATEREVSAVVNKAMAALRETGPVAHPDSVAYWIAASGSASEFRPLSGTYRALLGTGDLRLVRNDSLRVRLTEYTSDLENEGERLRELRNVVIAQAPTMARAVPFMRWIFLNHGTVSATEADIQAFRADPAVAVVVFTLQAANQNRLDGLRHILKTTRDLERALEAEPALRADAARAPGRADSTTRQGGQ